MLIGGVECAGNETGLLECPHVAGSHEAVTDCDPREVAAVACQGKPFLVHARCAESTIYQLTQFVVTKVKKTWLSSMYV